MKVKSVEKKCFFFVFGREFDIRVGVLFGVIYFSNGEAKVFLFYFIFIFFCVCLYFFLPQLETRESNSCQSSQMPRHNWAWITIKIYVFTFSSFRIFFFFFVLFIYFGLWFKARVDGKWFILGNDVTAKDVSKLELTRSFLWTSWMELIEQIVAQYIAPRFLLLMEFPMPALSRRGHQF